MEKGRFADWPEEPGGSETVKPESSDTRKKKSRRSSDSPHPEAAPEPKAEKPKRPEPEKVSRALTDFIIEHDPAEHGQPARERAKEKSGDTSSATAEKHEAEQARFVAVPAVEQVVGHPEAAKYDRREESDDDDDDPEEENEPHHDEHAEIPEHEHLPDDGKWPEYVLPLELEPNQLNGGEVILRLHDDEPHTTRESQPEPERAPEPVVEAAGEQLVPEVLPVASAGADHWPELPPTHAYEAPPPEIPEAPTPAESGGEEPPVDGPDAEAVPGAFEMPSTQGEPMVPLAETHRLDPAEAYRQYMAREAADQVTADSAYGEPMVTKRAAEDDAYYAARQAQSRGFVSGLLVAGLWARHRGKKLRRQFDKQFKKQGKELQQARGDQRFNVAEQAKRQATNNRELAAVRTQLAGTERQLNQQQLAGRQAERVAQQLERTGRQSEQALAQQERAAREITRSRQSQEQNAGELLEVPPEHRLETSAWHTIEVDARTGKPVEQPTFAYGQEYYRERAHEVAALDKRSTVAAEAAIAGAAAADSGGGVAGSAAGQGGAPTPLPTSIPSASTQGAPRAKLQAKLQSAKDSLVKPKTTGPVWPFVVALVAIFIALVFLI